MLSNCGREWGGWQPNWEFGGWREEKDPLNLTISISGYDLDRLSWARVREGKSHWFGIQSCLLHGVSGGWLVWEEPEWCLWCCCDWCWGIRGRCALANFSVGLRCYLSDCLPDWWCATLDGARPGYEWGVEGSYISWDLPERAGSPSYVSFEVERAWVFDCDL